MFVCSKTEDCALLITFVLRTGKSKANPITDAEMIMVIDILLCLL